MEARRQLVWIALIQVLAMSLWFSASAVSAALGAEWNLTGWGQSLLTSSVQLGFVAGALGSAVLNLADRIDLRILLGLSAAAGAVSNALVALVSEGLATAVPLRFLTGVALAGVYPVGMKLMTTWFSVDRGLALGVLVGALTLGSAIPHLTNALTPVSWRPVLYVSSVMALGASALGLYCVRIGPHAAATPRLDPMYVVRMFRDRDQRLINFGYLGHMWELYALWAWLPTFIAMSVHAWRPGALSASIVSSISFGAIGVMGATGCVLAGRAARRRGSVAIAREALALSALCCVVSPLFYASHPALLMILVLVWCAAVIADSAQFSSALSDVAEPRYVGTALTVQTALGFALTMVTIQLVPVLADLTGWRFGLLLLGVGPVLGAISMAMIASPARRRVARADGFA